MGLKSAFGVAAISLLISTNALAADPRAAQVSAALPTEVSGYAKSSDDIVDVSGTPPALTVLRFLAGSVGLAQIQVRVWTVADTVADAEIMLDPETLRMFEGKPVEIAGHKGAFVNGVLVVYPGLPTSTVTVSVGGLKDGDVLTGIAEKIDYQALIAIP
jgi:hypothetical protein